MSHVLIVEDEAHLAKGLQFNLEAEGHSVAVVGDGESALNLLLGNPRTARPPSSTPSCSTSCFPARMVLRSLPSCAPPSNSFPCSCSRRAGGPKMFSRVCLGRGRLSSQTLRTPDPAGAIAGTAAPPRLDAPEPGRKCHPGRRNTNPSPSTAAPSISASWSCG